MRIGELTLDRVADICKKCENDQLGSECPFQKIELINCCYNNDAERRKHLNDELEVDINECCKN